LENDFYVISFESTHYAIMVEKLLKDNFKIYVIPTPREITASCGLSIRFSKGDLDSIKDILQNNDIDTTKMGIYKVSKEKRTSEQISWR